VLCRTHIPADEERFVRTRRKLVRTASVLWLLAGLNGFGPVALRASGLIRSPSTRTVGIAYVASAASGTFRWRCNRCRYPIAPQFLPSPCNPCYFLSFPDGTSIAAFPVAMLRMPLARTIRGLTQGESPATAPGERSSRRQHKYPQAKAKTVTASAGSEVFPNRVAQDARQGRKAKSPVRRLGQVLEFFGVADGTRTRDNRNHNPGLYQLSYGHRRHRFRWGNRSKQKIIQTFDASGKCETQ
jgi:hypothetical protein